MIVSDRFFAFAAAILVALCMGGGTAGAQSAPRSSGRLPAGGTSLQLLSSRLDQESLAVRQLALRPPLRALPPGGLRGHTVTLGDGVTEDLQQLSGRLFADNETFEREASAAARALAGPPQVTAEAFELPDAFVLVRSTRVVVTDPSALARSSGDFRSFLSSRTAPPMAGAKPNPGGRPNDLRIRNESAIRTARQVPDAALEPESRAGFDRFLAEEVPRLPPDDPIALAAREGREAVLQAIAEGKGEFEIIDTFVVPREPLAMVDGQLQHLIVRDGLLSHGESAPARSPLLRALGRSPADGLELRPTERPSNASDGTHRFTQPFLTGFTRGIGWEWERRWNFPSGFFRITLGAGISIGLRAPIEVSGSYTPAHVQRRDDRDREDAVKLSFNAETVDGSAQFYRSTGLDRELVSDGQEFVFEFDLYFGYRLRALWTNLAHSPNAHYGFDAGADFKPPLGGSGSLPRIEIPASVTGTRIGVDYLHGDAQIGFQPRARGEVSVDYDALWGNRVVRSQTVTFDRPGEMTIDERLPALTVAEVGDSARQGYGFRLSNPTYRADLSLTPQIRLGLTAGYSSFSRSFSTGWMSLNELRIQLGSVKLPRHPGTVAEYRFDDGVKEYARINTSLADRVPASIAEATAPRLVSLRSAQSGRFVRAGFTSDTLLSARSPEARGWETFEIQDVGQGLVTLRSRQNGRYVRAGVGPGALLAATSDHARSWETFRLVRRPDGRVTLQSVQNQKYVRAGIGEDSLLAATSDRVGGWETFELTEVR